MPGRREAARGDRVRVGGHGHRRSGELGGVDERDRRFGPHAVTAVAPDESVHRPGRADAAEDLATDVVVLHVGPVVGLWYFVLANNQRPTGEATSARSRSGWPARSRATPFGRGRMPADGCCSTTGDVVVHVPTRSASTATALERLYSGRRGARAALRAPVGGPVGGPVGQAGFVGGRGCSGLWRRWSAPAHSTTNPERQNRTACGDDRLCGRLGVRHTFHTSM